MAIYLHIIYSCLCIGTAELCIRDVDSFLGSGRSPGGCHGNPLQYSCLENPVDRGQNPMAAVSGITKSWTWLRNLAQHTAQKIGGIIAPVLYESLEDYLAGNALRRPEAQTHLGTTISSASIWTQLMQKPWLSTSQHTASREEVKSAPLLTCLYT